MHGARESFLCAFVCNYNVNTLPCIYINLQTRPVEYSRAMMDSLLESCMLCLTLCVVLYSQWLLVESARRLEHMMQQGIAH